ncbi:MAG: RiPP maturation radical SAM protein 1 [Desulfarculus sp.]|nr:RiPP maturation radical SAM protein 1 [Desulfarculus sp.]
MISREPAGVDVCLVAMPFSRPTGPSLALGLLQAALRQGGFNAVSLYANLVFFERVSFSEDGWVSACSRDQSLGEWLFAGAAFPDFQPDHDQYLALVRARNAVYRLLSLEAFKERCWSLRQRAATLVEDMVSRVLELRPRVVGCSSTCVQHVASLALLRRIKQISPATVTMLGGANCEGDMGLASHRAFPWVDYVVSGEADDLIVDLVKGVLEHGREFGPGGLAEGVLAPCHRRLGYPGQTGDPPRATARDLGRLPLADYGDYFAELERSPVLKETVRPGLLVESSRGCWWGRCRFCSLDGRKCGFRSKPPERVLEELAELRQRHGVDRFLFTDSLLNRAYFDSLLPELERLGAPYRLFIEIKSNLDRRELLSLQRGGFTFLQPGIESFSTPHLAHMNKGVQAWQNVQAVKLCRELGLGCVYNLLHALPGERDEWMEEMAELVPWLTHLRPPATLCQVRFDRLSHYAEHPSEWGLELRPSRAFQAIYPLLPEQIAGLVYSFVDQDREAVADSPFLSLALQSEAMLKLIRRVRAWRAAYFSPTPPMLSWRQEDQAVLVSDSRLAAIQAGCRLEGLERDLFLRAADAPPALELRARFLGQGVEPRAWEAALSRLKDWGYLVELDGRLVGLALAEPVPPEPLWDDFGGGSIDLNRLAQIQRAGQAGAAPGPCDA